MGPWVQSSASPKWHTPTPPPPCPARIRFYLHLFPQCLYTYFSEGVPTHLSPGNYFNSPKYNCVPLHDVVFRRCTTDPHRWVLLQSRNPEWSLSELNIKVISEVKFYWLYSERMTRWTFLLLLELEWTTLNQSTRLTHLVILQVISKSKGLRDHLSSNSKI